jgi:hypothetical protein
LIVAFSDESRGELKLRLELNNEDSAPGSASSIQWEVWLQRHWFAEGEQSLAQPLASSGNTQFEVRLPLAFVRRGIAAAQGAPVEFLVRGVLTAHLGGSDQALGFQRTLTVVAPGAPIWIPGTEEE